MSLELTYNIRNLRVRKTSTILTLVGITLVVFVFVASLMLSQGLKHTLSSTGSPRNAIVIRSGAQNEVQSGVTREQARIIMTQPEVEKDARGMPLGTADTVVLISLKKRSDGQPSNVNVRGVQNAARDVRPGLSLVKGKWPEPGSKELVVGKGIFEKFQGTAVGDSIRLVGINWPVVGIFEAGTSSFNSEIWGDADILTPAFHRDGFSSVTVRLRDTLQFDVLKNRLENDPRFTVSMKRENDFYADQSRGLSLFITILGTFLSVVFSIGAIIGAMITMYSSVANRTREIGILRALGFGRRAILLAFLKECILIAFCGGMLGIGLASFLSFVGISTTNFATFSEVAFGFRMTPTIALMGIMFALVMGLLGGIFPAVRASRVKVLDALRAD